ncbi:hypothetical protein [Streptomyces avicenniae]|uniref:hypothetical protein n=1 Tax=Streptomyces avicenniae TaxID=500153 RepID=UPI000DA5FBC3|nr:hypothetical protein [Streptomyces avicenniae]
MPRTARLVSTLAAPLPFSRPDEAPCLDLWPTTRLLVQRGERELAVRDLTAPATSPTVRIPAPWPGGIGQGAVSPFGDQAVFTGPHALRAVDLTGNTRWELRHRCWAGCAGHTDITAYADDREHGYAGSGSACFSSDGKLVWAHIPADGDGGDGADWEEEWVVIDAVDGTVLGRVPTRTAAAGSHHIPHPDPAQMGLSIGEGQDGAPLRWGRWDGHALALHRTADGSVESELTTASLAPDDSSVYFDYDGRFLDADTLVVATVDGDDELGAARHWLVTTSPLRPTDELTYPFPVDSLPTGLGDGTWYTTSTTDNSLHLWTL